MLGFVSGCECVIPFSKKFSLEFNFRYLAMANSLNFNSANYKILKNLSMMAYIPKV